MQTAKNLTTMAHSKGNKLIGSCALNMKMDKHECRTTEDKSLAKERKKRYMIKWFRSESQFNSMVSESVPKHKFCC